MLQLLINKAPIDLKSKTIELNIEYDLLDFEQLLSASSLPIECALSENNRRLFDFAENIAIGQNQFIEYPNAELFFQGNLLMRGRFALQKANQKQGYKGVFLNDAATLSEYKDLSIKDMMPADSWVFSSYSGDTMRHSPLTFEDRDFWLAEVRQSSVLFNPSSDQGDYLLSSPDLPMPTLLYVLRKVLEYMGFTIDNNWTAEREQLRRLLFVPNAQPYLSAAEPTADQLIHAVEGIDFDYNNPDAAYFKDILSSEFKIRDLVPDMKLKDFINGLRKLFSLQIRFHSFSKTIRIYFSKDILLDKRYADWTAQAEALYEISKPTYEGIVFSMAQVEDTAQGVYPSEIDEAKYLGERILPPMDTLIEEGQQRTYYLHRNHFCYYRAGFMPWFLLDDGTPSFYGWAFMAAAHVPPYALDEKKLKIETPFTSLTKGKWTEFFKEKTVDLIKCTWQNWVGSSPAVAIQIDLPDWASTEIVLTDSKLYPNSQPLRILQRNGDQIVLWLNWKGDESNVRIKLRKKTDRYLPQSDVKINEQGSSEVKPRLLFCWGAQADSNGQKYVQASPDNLDSNNSILGPYSLAWDGDSGLIKNFWSEWIDFYTHHKVYESRIQLNFNQLFSLLNGTFEDDIESILVKKRIRDTLFFVRKIKVALSDKGIQAATAELYSLSYAAEKRKVYIAVSRCPKARIVTHEVVKN